LIKIIFPAAYGIAVLSQAKITDKPHFEGVFNLYAFFNERNNLIEFQSSEISERSNDEILEAIKITAKYAKTFCELHDNVAHPS